MLDSSELSISGLAQCCALEAGPVLVFPLLLPFYVAIVCRLVIVLKVKGEGITPEVSLWFTLYVSGTHLKVFVQSSSGFFLSGQARHPGGAGSSTLT
jgi:hypothetical protein